MGLEDLPAPIQDHIRQVVGADYPVRPGSYHVTELLYCMRKCWLRRLHPEDKEKDLGGDYNLYRGKMFDKAWTHLFRRHQIRVTHRIPDGPVIVGKFDFVWDDAVWDLKTIKNLHFIKKANKPHDQDVRQVQFYAYVENMDKGMLAYVDLGDAVVVPVDCSDEALVDNIRHLEGRALKLAFSCTNSSPAPAEGLANKWECGYCEMKPHCDVIEGIGDPKQTELSGLAQSRKEAIEFNVADPDVEGP